MMDDGYFVINGLCHVSFIHSFFLSFFHSIIYLVVHDQEEYIGELANVARRLATRWELPALSSNHHPPRPSLSLCLRSSS